MSPNPGRPSSRNTAESAKTAPLASVAREGRAKRSLERDKFSQLKPVGFIGGGFFAELIIKKLLQTETLGPKEIIVGVRRQVRAEELTSRYGVITFVDGNDAVCRKSRSLILAVKPHQVRRASQGLSAAGCSGKLLMSIVAAVKTKTLRELFNTPKVCRVNPNPQIASGQGLTAVSSSGQVTALEAEWVARLFGCMSEVVPLDEDQLDCISVLSGITHSLYYVECLMAAALYLGLPPEIARKIVIQSLDGAVEAFRSHPEEIGKLLRDAATPGGIGVEKLFTLDRLGVKGAIIESMKAGLKKAQQLGRRQGEDA